MTLRNFAFDLDDPTYQAARQRAQQEGRSLETVLAELLTTYAGGQPERVMTTYTVQRGDTLSRIARQVYGDPHKYPLLQKANNLTDPGRIWVGQVLVVPSLTESGAATPPPAPPQPAPPQPPPAPTTPTTPPPPAPTPSPTPPPQPPPRSIDPCAPIPGQSYGTLPIVGSPTDRPAAQHGDINFALRGYNRVEAAQNLIDMSGPTDSRAPQLATLFADTRTPAISNVYRANHWDWGSNARGGPITDFQVTVAGFKVDPGETIHVPNAGYEIGQGYAVLVLYADHERITLKYTGEDSVVSGYTLHIDGVCVEPNLMTLYAQMNAAGRRQLPALRARQAFGRARSNEIQVAVRDTGRFMDPRVRKDWWRGR